MLGNFKLDSGISKYKSPLANPLPKTQTNVLVRFSKTDTYYVARLRRVYTAIFDSKKRKAFLQTLDYQAFIKKITSSSPHKSPSESSDDNLH